jgi:hypothetical protein
MASLHRYKVVLHVRTRAFCRLIRRGIGQFDGPPRSGSRAWDTSEVWLVAHYWRAL